MKELAPDYKIVYKSENPQKDYGFSAGILVRPSGRYIASYDISDKYGKICISDDEGETWSKPSFLTENEKYNHCAIDAWHKD